MAWVRPTLLAGSTHEASDVTFPHAGNVKVPVRLLRDLRGPIYGGWNVRDGDQRVRIRVQDREWTGSDRRLDETPRRHEALAASGLLRSDYFST